MLRVSSFVFALHTPECTDAPWQLPPTLRCSPLMGIGVQTSKTGFNPILGNKTFFK